MNLPPARVWVYRKALIPRRRRRDGLCPDRDFRLMSALKILVIPGSLRTGSLNARLAAVAAQELALAGAEVTPHLARGFSAADL